MVPAGFPTYIITTGKFSQPKETEMGRTYSTYGDEERSIQGLGGET